MRITNITKAPRYFSLDGVHGRMLAAGATSAEMPLSTAFSSQLWKEIDAKRVHMQLSADDKAFIGKVLSADAIVVELPAPVKAPVITVVTRVKGKRVVKPRAKVPGVRMNPGGATGQPVFSQVPEPVIKIVKPGQAKSLAELQMHNRAIKAPAGIPINPRGTAPGQPAFSPGAGPGTENTGVGRASADTIPTIAGFMGGKV